MINYGIPKKKHLKKHLLELDLIFFPVKFSKLWLQRYEQKTCMFRKMIWANFVGYDSTRYYIIHNAYISFKVWRLNKNTSILLLINVADNTWMFFFKFWNFTRIGFMPIHFCRVSGCSKIIGHQLWPGWHESHDRRVHELEDHWLLGPQQKIQAAVKIIGACKTSGGVCFCFGGWGWKFIGIRNAQLFWGDGHPKCSFWRKNPTIYRQIWGNMVFLSSEHGNIQLVLGVILVGKEAGSAWNKKGGFSLFLPM